MPERSGRGIRLRGGAGRLGDHTVDDQDGPPDRCATWAVPGGAGVLGVWALPR